MQLRIAHTADLEPGTLAAARELLAHVFEGDFSDEDWEHALGGMHALLYVGGELIAHASVIQRRLLHRGRALRAGYVEGVGVRADRRREGHGTTIMRELGRIIRGGYEIGGLGTTDEAVRLYESLGWRRWAGPLYVLTPDGVRRTPDEEGAVYVLELGVALDRAGELTCDWRDGDVW